MNTHRMDEMSLQESDARRSQSSTENICIDEEAQKRWQEKSDIAGKRCVNKETDENQGRV